MTADEEFEKWWEDAHFYLRERGTIRQEYCRVAYLAATKATAARCVEICEKLSHSSDGRSKVARRVLVPHDVGAFRCAETIKKEFDLE